jgi:homoserine O-acetyltransferase
MVAMISYRSAESFHERFGRELHSEAREATGKYEVESYLHYQGEKLVARFDANCYLRITEAMDDFDLGEGRDGPAAALGAFTGPALVMGINSDILYPTWQQRELQEVLRANGNDVSYAEIDSIHGHDAFLMEWAQLDEAIRRFLRRVRG